MASASSSTSVLSDDSSNQDPNTARSSSSNSVLSDVSLNQDPNTAQSRGLKQPSKLPTPCPQSSRLKRTAVPKIKVKKSLEGPGGKKVKVENEEQENKTRNPLLTRVTKKKARRSIQKARQVTSTAAKRHAAGIGSSRAPAVKPTLRPSARPASSTAATTSASSEPGSKKVKRSAWDYKGQLEDMKELLAKEKETSAIQKEKALQTEDILRRLEALEGERKVIAVENSNLSGDIQQRDNEIASLRSEISRLNDDHERAIRALRLDLEDSRRDLRKVRDERDELDLQLRASKKENCELEKKNETIKSEFNALQEEHNKLSKENAENVETLQRQTDELQGNEIDRKRLLNEVQELKGNIRVFCRVRPNIKDEDPPQHINYEGQAGKSLNVTNHEKESKYSFDKVFGPQATQAAVYEELDQLVQSSLDGFNVCVFAYGQTGSGKTYTMEGPDDYSEENCGIIPRAMKQIFIKCQNQKKLGWEYDLKVEHVEIYCEILQDLLRSGNNAEKLDIRTKGPSGEAMVWVPNLSSHSVTKYADIMKLMALSKRRRATAQTAANDHSSRSHSVFMLRITATNEATGQKTESALNLIDLAGSERCGDTGATGQRLKEGKKINSSLTALSCVISALANKDSHVPYRNSKLTLLLMNSLGGNSKTLMVVNINPSPTSSSETVNTLRFATTVNQCNIGTAQKVVKF
ncbi:carboxy-terminal kinesin 2-like [Styela clava]